MQKLFHRREDEEAQFVEIERKISCLEWITIITGPLVMPLFGPFILIFGIKTYLAEKRQQRIISCHQVDTKITISMN